MQVLDGGRAFNGGNPPAELEFSDAHVAEPAEGRAAADHPRRRAEGLVQGPACSSSTATWKIWGNSQGTLD